MNHGFKQPHTIPQDLLLIQDIVATTPPIAQNIVPVDDDTSDDDSIASTDHDVDSEVEVEAGLFPPEENPRRAALANVGTHQGSDSDFDSESSSGEESDTDLAQNKATGPSQHDHTSDVEFEESGAVEDIGYTYTRNEIVDADITIPEVSEVSPEDVLDKVGEVMSIVGNVVIVKGLPADSVKTLSERALDSETLLVFEDRRVLGYVYETFGPTSQPMYQIKFNQKYPLDTGKVQISRQVFHVPKKSKYVFVEQLKKIRGSDASNIHDEEPAEDELDFSDDEKETAFKQQRKKRRQQSVASSRQVTPTPSQAQTDDAVDEIFYGSNPYDAHGPYDDNYRISGPSRQAPLPYDDPYAEQPPPDITEQAVSESTSVRSQWSPLGVDERPSGVRGRGRGHGNRGRGRGREGKGQRGRTHRSRSTPHQTARENLNLHGPPSGTFEDAVGGHFSDSVPMYSQSQLGSIPWSYQTQSFQPPVQPHINPRFASAFGLTLPGHVGQWSSQQAPTAPYYVAQPQRSWGVPWTHPGEDSADGSTYTPM
ncbi:hypothetical protein ID866_2013 [Astraeus odoratus]|nr:hypothetical protein ID866_2013 [Astraeus odoratus]